MRVKFCLANIDFVGINKTLFFLMTPDHRRNMSSFPNCYIHTHIQVGLVSLEVPSHIEVFCWCK